MRRALADRRVVLGGFRTVIEGQDRPLLFMTVHQYLKTFYLPLLLRPLSFFRWASCFEPICHSLLLTISLIAGRNLLLEGDGACCGA